VCAEWSQGLTIPALLERDATLLSPFPIVLITCIDSHRQVTGIERLTSALAGAGARSTAVGDAVALDATVLPRLLEDEGLFTGFDGLWFFPADPIVTPPARVHITAEAPIGRQDARRLAPWVFRSGAQLGLGDGDGLNVVAQDITIVDAIRSGS
jgi:hypothetical protein